MDNKFLKLNLKILYYTNINKNENIKNFFFFYEQF